MHIPSEAQAILKRFKSKRRRFKEIAIAWTNEGYYVCAYRDDNHMYWTTKPTALAACREVERQWLERQGKPTKKAR